MNMNRRSFAIFTICLARQQLQRTTLQIFSIELLVTPSRLLALLWKLASSSVGNLEHRLANLSVNHSILTNRTARVLASVRCHCIEFPSTAPRAWCFTLFRSGTTCAPFSHGWLDVTNIKRSKENDEKKQLSSCYQHWLNC